MNVKLLRKVQKFLLAEPRRFDMNHWISGADEYDVLKPPPCGTACCIAGAAFLIDQKIKPKGAPEKVEYEPIESTAAESLGLDDDGENRLFYTEGWPLKFRSAYATAKTPLQRAKAGVARIEHFIKTGGAE